MKTLANILAYDIEGTLLAKILLRLLFLLFLIVESALVYSLCI